jgi:hypothetical protein
VYRKKKILFNNMKAGFLSKNRVRFSLAIGLALSTLVQVQARPSATVKSALHPTVATSSLGLAVLALVVLGFGSLVFRAAIRRR